MVRFPAGQKMFSSPIRPKWVLGRPSLLFNGYRFLLLPWVKRLGRKSDHLTPYNADARNKWSFGFSPHILLWLDKKNLPFTVIFRVLLGFRINFCMNFLLLSVPSYLLVLMTCAVLGEKYELLSF